MRLLTQTNLHVILACAFLAVTGNGILGPLLSSLAESLGRSLEETSLLLTVFSGAVVLATPILGLLADRYGRRRVLLPAIFLFGIGACIPLIDSYALILGIRALQGVAVAAMATLAVTLIGDLYTGPDRVQAMALRTSAHSLGFAVSPFVAGALATLNIFYPFYFFVLAFPLWLYAYVFLDTDAHHFSNRQSRYVQDIWLVLTRRQTLSVFYAIFHVCVLFYIMLVFVPILLFTNFSLTPLLQGLILGGFFLLAAIVSGFAQPLMERYRDEHIIIYSFVVFALCCALLPTITSVFWFVCVVCVWAVAHGLCFTPVYVLATSLTPFALRGGAVAGAFVMTYVGVTVSPLVFMAIYSVTGEIRAVFYTGALFAVWPWIAYLGHLYTIEEQSPETIFGTPDS